MALVVGTLLEQGRNLAYPLIHRDFDPPEVYEWIGESGGGLIELPMRMSQISIAWQAVHEQPTFGGMAENAELFWPEGYEERVRKPFARQLWQLTMNPGHFKCCDSLKMQDGIDELRSEGFRWIVLDRHLVDSNLHNTPYGRELTPNGYRWGLRHTRLAHWRLGRSCRGRGSAIDLGSCGWRETAETSGTDAGGSSHARTWPMDDMPAYEAHHNKIH